MFTEKQLDRYADVREIEALSPPEKAAYFEKLLEPCIRCYACRNACPLCYCPTCFTDESRPQWVGKGQASLEIVKGLFPVPVSPSGLDKFHHRLS